MTTPKTAAQPTAWEKLLASLPVATARALDPKPSNVLARPVRPAVLDEDEAGYADLLESLPVATATALAAEAGTREPSDPPVDTSAAKYWLIECPDGDWPTLRSFRTEEGMARRIGQLEGADVVVLPLYGISMQITEGPQRYLLLPGGAEAVQIPAHDGGPARIVDASLLDKIPISTTGYLGPKDLIEVPAPVENPLPSGDEDEPEDP